MLLGWGLARLGFLSAPAFQDLNRLTYWVAMPCFLFQSLAGASHGFAGAADLLTVSAAATLLIVLLAGLGAWLFGVPKRALGTFVQGAFRGNMGFIGLPVVVYAFSAAGGADSTAATSALLVFGPMVVLYNLLAVLVLLSSGEAAEASGEASAGGAGAALRRAAYGWLSNPILLACLGGLLFALLEIGLPAFARRGLAAVGQLALPSALLCIGAALHTARVQGSLPTAVAASILKVALLPVIGLLLARWIGLSADLTRIALIFLACPTASASYVLAQQLKGDAALASSIVVVSTVLAVPALVAVLAVTG